MNTSKLMMLKPRRAAFTLVEMLIAMALTLILVYSIAEFYAYIGNAVRDGRATIEMGGQLRAATAQLNEDLQSLTLRPTPWIDANTSPGYFTVYEGPGYDANPDASNISTSGNLLAAIANNDPNVPDLTESANVTTLIGDGDDVLAFTIRAKDVPFQGRYNGGSTTSQFAEVIWFTCFVDADGDSVWDINEPRFLCRRILLILPNIGNAGILTAPAAQNTTVNSLRQFQQDNDVSVTIVANGGSNYSVKANSLADLSRRENRFACRMANNATAMSTFPFELDLNPNRCDVNPASGMLAMRAYSLQGNVVGEDRVLSNLLAFDVRVFDPEARILQTAGVALTVGDPGYANVAANEADPLNTSPLSYPPYGPQESVPLGVIFSTWPNIEGLGAWVDLNYNNKMELEASSPAASKRAYTHFSGARRTPLPTGYVVPVLGYNVWDTWPENYLRPPYGNGQAFDGLDNDGANGVDDAGERTPARDRPPYAFPLRGIQVRIRMYEPQTRQMRQATVGSDFVGD